MRIYAVAVSGLDALIAYDMGFRDSGIKDDSLKQAIQEYLSELNDQDFRMVVSKYARQYLTNEKLEGGWGLEDVLEFVKWLRNELGIDI